jgi:hypothetical protein
MIVDKQASAATKYHPNAAKCSDVICPKRKKDTTGGGSRP